MCNTAGIEHLRRTPAVIENCTLIVLMLCGLVTNTVLLLSTVKAQRINAFTKCNINLAVASLVYAVAKLIPKAYDVIAVHLANDPCMLEMSRMSCCLVMWLQASQYVISLFIVAAVLCERAAFTHRLRKHHRYSADDIGRWLDVAGHIKWKILATVAPWLFGWLLMSHRFVAYTFIEPYASTSADIVVHCAQDQVVGNAVAEKLTQALLIVVPLVCLVYYRRLLRANERFWDDFGRQPQPLLVRMAVKRSIETTRAMLTMVTLHAGMGVLTMTCYTAWMAASGSDVGWLRHGAAYLSMATQMLSGVSLTLGPLVLVCTQRALRNAATAACGRSESPVHGGGGRPVDNAKGPHAQHAYFEQYEF